MDIVFINQLSLHTIIGIHEWERQQSQPIILDIEIGHDFKQAARTDNIDYCIDYFSVCERLTKLASEHQFQLVESFAEAVSKIILNEFKSTWVKVKVSKPQAVEQAKNVGVIIERHRESLTS